MPATILSFGEILWDRLPSGPQLGGAPFNFAYRLASLGENALCISRLGDDDLGRQAYAKAQELGMDTRFIQWDPHHPTGTVNIDLSNPNHPEYDIIPAVAYDFTEPTAAMLDTATHADCICFGTLNQREETARNTLAKILDAMAGKTKLLDINLREKCYTTETIESSLRLATILKLNQEEARYLEETFSLQSNNLPHFCENIIARFSLRLCIITLGEQGAFVMNAQQQTAYDPGYKIDLVDPCGSGDAFTAGFITQYLADKPLLDCCRYGNALGALVATHAGATTPVPTDTIEQFLAEPKPRVRYPDFIGM
jgi:fructokinase